MLLGFYGGVSKGFELWNTDHPDTPYKVVEVAQLEERTCALFSLYDDALDFINKSIYPYGEKRSEEEK